MISICERNHVTQLLSTVKRHTDGHDIISCTFSFRKTWKIFDTSTKFLLHEKLGVQGQYHKVIYGPQFFFFNFRQRTSFSHYQVLKKDHQRWHRRKKRSKYAQCDSVVFCNLVARNLLQFSHRNLTEVELKDDRCIGAFQISIFQHNQTIKINRIEQLLMEENSKATT